MSPEPLKILLIGHEPGFNRAVSRMLSQAGDLPAQVSSVESLRGGIAELGRTPYDVVMCDLGLPDGAGLANVPLIHAKAPEVPIIVAGESDNEAVAVESVHAGAQDYIVKPQLTPGWLERSLRYAIERHRLDRALQEAEQKYHGVFDHLLEGIFQTSPDGHYLMANAALARIYGYGSPEEMVNQLTDIGRSLYVREGRREEFVRLMQANDVITGFQSQVYRKDGSIIWISENCRAIRDPDGRLLHYEGTVEDITQRLEAEEKLRNSEALYHSLVETLPQNIFRKDLEGRFTFANQQFCKTLGRPLDQIIGRTDRDFFPAELAAKYTEDDRRVLSSGVPYDIVEEHQPPGGAKMYVQVVKTPIYDLDGKPLGLQGIFWDITEQRNAQEAIRKAHERLALSQAELQAKNLQMQEDLRMARDVQETLLPQHYPVFRSSPGQTSSSFQFTHRYRPASGSVGGDFFSVSPISGAEAGIFVCDVAGHGVRAALITTMIRALVEELKPCASDPGLFLSRLNGELCTILKHTDTPLLTSAIYLVANCADGSVVYANAGHPRPFHLATSAGQVRPLSSPGGFRAALGLFESAQYPSARVELKDGDRLLLFTDGLVEVHGKAQELYTPELLAESIRRCLHRSADDLCDQVLRDAEQFSSGGFTDDVCLLCMDYHGPAGATPKP